MGENDSENPWENASNDQAFREQAESQGGAPQTTGEPSTPGGTSVRWDIDESNNVGNGVNDLSILTSDTTAEANGRRGSRASCPKNCSLSYLLHVWDISLTVSWATLVGYHLYYNKANETSRSLSMDALIILLIVLAALNALRGILWIWAALPSLSTICCCGCCFVDDSSFGVYTVSKLATHLTLLLGLLYGSITITAWFGPSTWLPWCGGFGPWCSELLHVKTAMPIVLAIASIIELVRWIFLQGQLSSTATMERTRSPDYYNDEFSSAAPSQTSRNRPWWFTGRRGNTGNDGLHEPLLNSGATSNGQPSWTTPSWMPFSTRSSNSNAENNFATANINGDEEDVESVLDSLGEDWASRAESDPYWWTR